MVDGRKKLPSLDAKFVLFVNFQAHKRTHDTDRPKKVRRNTKKPKVEENAENIDNTIEESSQNDDAIILIISE